MSTVALQTTGSLALDDSSNKPAEANAETNAGTSTVRVYIPDILQYYPWPTKIHPHGRENGTRATEWIMKINPVTPKTAAAFTRCDFGLLAAMAYAELDDG